MTPRLRDAMDGGTDRIEAHRAADPATVLGALDDEDCRRIVTAVTEQPRTAKELADCCELPLSTTYRKLERLTEAALLEERTRIRTGGKHARQYARNFEGLLVDVTDDGGLVVDVVEDVAPQPTEGNGATLHGEGRRDAEPGRAAIATEATEGGPDRGETDLGPSGPRDADTDAG